MVVHSVVVAVPLAAGLTPAAAVSTVDADLVAALRVDGASEAHACCGTACDSVRGLVVVAIAAAFGRAISEVGASLMVGGNILNETRILTTAITLETGRATLPGRMALGLILLALALLVNVALTQGGRRVLEPALS